MGIFDPNIFDSKIFKVGKRIIEKIKERIPGKRAIKKVMLEILILGNVAHFTSRSLSIKGDFSRRIRQVFKAKGIFSTKLRIDSIIRGSSFHYLRFKREIQGYPFFKLESLRSILGNLSEKTSLSFSVFGEKDLSKILFWLLEEEG